MIEFGLIFNLNKFGFKLLLGKDFFSLIKYPNFSCDWDQIDKVIQINDQRQYQNKSKNSCEKQ